MIWLYNCMTTVNIGDNKINRNQRDLGCVWQFSQIKKKNLETSLEIVHTSLARTHLKLKRFVWADAWLWLCYRFTQSSYTTMCASGTLLIWHDRPQDCNYPLPGHTVLNAYEPWNHSKTIIVKPSLLQGGAQPPQPRIGNGVRCYPAPTRKPHQKSQPKRGSPLQVGGHGFAVLSKSMPKNIHVLLNHVFFVCTVHHIYFFEQDTGQQLLRTRPVASWTRQFTYQLIYT